MRLGGQLSVFGAILFAAGCGAKKDASADAKPPVPVKALSVEAQDVRQAYRYSGEIRPDVEVKLSFKQSGYVASLYRVHGIKGELRDVQVGDQVAAGTVLAQLRKGDFRASVTQAKGQENSSKGAVGSAHADLDQAKADQSKAEQAFHRAEALYTAKALTRPDYDDAVAQYKAATAKVDGSMQQIATREGQLQSAEGETASAEIALNETNLSTPMPAVILSKDIEPGSLVSAGTLGFTIADTRVVKMEFGVPESMLSQFPAGSLIPVQVQGAGTRTLPGRVTQVSPSATNDSRVFKIQISLPNHDHSLRVGMIGSVAIDPLGERQPMPLVPITALTSSGSGSTSYSVFVITESNGKQIAQLRSVRIGETVGRSIAIREGLVPGDRIIVNRPNQLSEGSEVRIVN